VTKNVGPEKYNQNKEYNRRLDNVTVAKSCPHGSAIMKDNTDYIRFQRSSLRNNKSVNE
jgi:hypothetical protein